jgi:Putative Ig domain
MARARCQCQAFRALACVAGTLGHVRARPFVSTVRVPWASTHHQIGSSVLRPFDRMRRLGSTSQTFTLKVDQPPAFTSPDTASAPIGSPFSFNITTTGYPAPRLTKLRTLPKGLTFKAGAGTITGTPASGTAGTYLITITAKNSSASTTQTITITVS